MSGFKQHFKLSVLASLCCLLWGTAIPTLKTMYDMLDIEPGNIYDKLILAGLRFLLAGCMIGFYLLVKNRRLESVKPRFWHQILIFGLLNTTLQYLFFYVGVGNTGAIKGVLLDTSKPLLVVILAHYFSHNDKFTMNKVIGLMVGFAGIMVANIDKLTSTGIELTATVSGEGALLMASVVYAIAVIYGKHIMKTMTSATLNMYQMIMGSLILLVAGVVGAGGIALDFDVWSGLLLVYSAALSAIAFVTWYYLINTYTASSVTIHIFLLPVFGSIISAILFEEEQYSVALLISLLMMCMSIILVNKKAKPIKT